MTPLQAGTTSTVLPQALVIGAGPEALTAVAPMPGANGFRVDFLDKGLTPYVAIRQRRPDLVVLCFAPDDEEACQVLQMLQPYFMCEYDETQAIGRRYRRQDEIGTPYCVTVDFDTLEDDAVTIRERDSMSQERISLSGVTAYFAERLLGC
mgnify:CR=1 FL=1